MKSFSRLRDEEGTGVERLLLGSAEGDAPMPGARARTLAALGVAGVAAGSAATAHAATAAALGGAGSKVASSSLTLVKWLAVGAVAGATATGGLVVATTPGTFGTESAPNRESAAAPGPVNGVSRNVVPSKPLADEPRAPGAADPVVQEPSGSSASRARAVTAGADAVTEPAPGPQGTAFPLPGGDNVAEEVRALDQARAALSSGDARGALLRLDLYQRRYPQGTLAPEAEVLRVRTLVQLGRAREARAAVDAFVRAHPGSPQAARLRALVGD